MPGDVFGSVTRFVSNIADAQPEIGQPISDTDTVVSSSSEIVDAAFLAEITHRIAIARAFGLVAIGLFVLFIILAVANVVHFALWLPALVGLVGVMIATGAQINRLEALQPPFAEGNE
jgi:hypothetical protein